MHVDTRVGFEATEDENEEGVANEGVANADTDADADCDTDAVVDWDDEGDTTAAGGSDGDEHDDDDCAGASHEEGEFEVSNESEPTTEEVTLRGELTVAAAVFAVPMTVEVVFTLDVAMVVRVMGMYCLSTKKRRSRMKRT